MGVNQKKCDIFVWQILPTPPYLSHTPSYFFFNFNNTLLNMVESVMSFSLFSSGGGCLW